MKRQIVRITAGSLFVLAWAGAGAYAFWGRGGTPTEAAPSVNASEMSKQIAQVNHEVDAAAKKITPLIATETKPVGGPPSANALFQPSASTKNSFKPEPGAFQPPTDVPETNSGYGEAPETGGYGDAPAVDVVEPAPYGSPPPARSVYGAAAATIGDEEPKPAYDPEAIAAPPSNFGGSNPLRSSNLQPPAELPNEVIEPAPGEELAAPPRRFPTGPAPQADEQLEPTPAVPAYGDRFPSTAARGLPLAAMPEESENVPLPEAAPLATKSIASAKPGEQSLEGAQAPSLVIEKFAPPEIQVGKPATFEIHVRNAGQTAAQHVQVSDHVPAGTQLVEAKPQPQAGANGALLWQLGAMEPGEEKTIVLQLMPQKEGEIGSVAQVTFAAAASAKTICTKPMLTIEHTAPAKVLMGEVVTLQISISNPGTGDATGVVLQADIPEGLAHSAGKELEYEVGTLRPGETKKLELTLEAAKAGVVQSTLRVKGDASLTATHSTQLEVTAPQLEVAMNGPTKRYLDRQATYTVSINNPGTAAARDVEIVAYLPKGMKFVSTDHEGQYDATHHAVYWSLEELPAAQKGSAQLVALPFEPGEQKLRVEGRSRSGLATSDEETVHVEAIPQLVFQIIDEADPIEVGAETVYQVKVTNVGSKAATNVQVAAGLPPELRPVSADGATRGAVQGQTVVFEPLGKLAPQAEAIFKIQATGLRTGDYTIRVQVGSDDSETPVTKEEHTRVYADR